VTELPGSQSALFRTATAVAKLGAEVNGIGGVRERAVWSGAIAPGWDIVANANGGYLLAIAARALGAALGRPDPVTISAHYLAPGKPGEVTIRTEVIKQDRAPGRPVAPARPGATHAAAARGAVRTAGGVNGRGPGAARSGLR
jgi:hypothetical protein